MQTISPHHRAIVEYYHALEQYREQHVTHELALKTAFQTLLGALAPLAGWTLIPEQALANGKRPDGFNLPRGYWEAKDSGDDMSTEIGKEYVARLIGRVVTVSVETVRLVGELARAVSLPAGAETEAPALVGEARSER